MNEGRFAILDPAAGISGDMLLGALLDAGARASWLEALPARLGIPEVSITISRTLRCGLSCAQVSIRTASGQTEHPSPAYADPHHHDHPADAHSHAHEPDHGQDHRSHRHLGDLLDVVERAPLSPTVRARAREAFRLLCTEEAHVHGVTPESVALHEVGAVDALVDIIGGIEGFEQLGVERVFSRPAALGNGWIRTAHGVIAVPAPVTTRLMEGLEIGPDGPVTGEATTPTGAVLLRVLSSGPPPARYRAVTTGWGAGGRNPADYPNALRLILAEGAPEAAVVVTLATDVDDLSPEYVDPLREALVAAGALDVQLWSTQMKKGRPGFRIEVICDPSTEAPVLEAFFLHSTTAGIRRSVSERVTLPRRQLEVPAGAGLTVKVKVLDTPGGPRVKAEFDDVRRAADRLGRPALEVARDVESTARALVAGSATGAPRSPKER
jgi:uncharacterized protein (TIGR00299 family) protein